MSKVKLAMLFVASFIIILICMTFIVKLTRPASPPIQASAENSQTISADPDVLPAVETPGELVTLADSDNKNSNSNPDTEIILAQQYQIDSLKQMIQVLQTQVKNDSKTVVKAELPETPDGESIKEMARIYENMTPEKAAQILTRLDKEVAARVIAQMKKRNAAKVMGALEPEKAVAISQAIADYN